MTKRNLFAEISEGFTALADERAGKKTLHTHRAERLPVLEIDAAELVALRERLHLSRPLFARYLLTPAGLSNGILLTPHHEAGALEPTNTRVSHA